MSLPGTDTVQHLPRLVLIDLSRDEADPLRRAGPLDCTPFELKPRYTPTDTWDAFNDAVALLITDEGRYGRPSPVISGLAYAEVHRAGPNEDRRRVDLSNAEVIRPPLPVDEVLATMRAGLREVVERAYENLSHPLPRTIGDELVQGLDRVRPGFAARIARTWRPDDQAAAGDPYARDRMRTASRFAGLGKTPPPVLQYDEMPATVEASRTLWESEVIAEDSLAFPGWNLSEIKPGAWLRFDGEGRSLFLKNIDAKPGEQTTGGDLVYVRKNPDCVVVVQYKRAAQRATRSGASWTVDNRFKAQLDRLTALDRWTGHGPETAPDGEGRDADEPRPTPAGGALGVDGEPGQALHATLAPEDFRLSPAAGYVKLVDGTPRKDAPGELFPGYYFPAAFLLERWRAAGRSTIHVDPARDRYLDSLSFVSLVAGGWIGSRGPLATDILERLYTENLLEAGQPVTLAVEEPAGPSSGRRPRRPRRL